MKYGFLIYSIYVFIYIIVIGYDIFQQQNLTMKHSTWQLKQTSIV